MEKEHRYPGTVVEVKGRKYIQLNLDIYLQLFKDVTTMQGINQDLINVIVYEYHQAKRYKKKRIRHKRLKQVAHWMFAVMTAVQDLDRDTLRELKIVEL